jgi:hypothetical protein
VNEKGEILMAWRQHMLGLDTLANIVGAGPIGGAESPAMYPGNPEVGALPNRGARGLVLGFGPTSVAAATTVTFNAQPNLVVRASRLMILGAIASMFSINDFRIGRNTQLLAANAVPAAAFAEIAVDSGIRGDTCTVGQLISLQVNNNAAASLTFSGALFGVAIDG